MQYALHPTSHKGIKKIPGKEEKWSCQHPEVSPTSLALFSAALAFGQRTRLSTLGSWIETLFPLNFPGSGHDNAGDGYVNQLDRESNRAHDEEPHANSQAGALELLAVRLGAALHEPQRVLDEGSGRQDAEQLALDPSPHPLHGRALEAGQHLAEAPGGHKGNEIAIEYPPAHTYSHSPLRWYLRRRAMSCSILWFANWFLG